MKCATAAAMLSPPRETAEPLTFAFTLPWPPSVNHYWLSLRKGPMAGRVILGNEGREYRVAVSEAIMVQRVPRRVLTGRLAVDVMAHPPDRRARDLDNLLKALLDSLHHADLILDDSAIDDLRIRRGTVGKPGSIEITVSEIPGEPTESWPLFDEVPP